MQLAGKRFICHILTSCNLLLAQLKCYCPLYPERLTSTQHAGKTGRISTIWSRWHRYTAPNELGLFGQNTSVSGLGTTVKTFAYLHIHDSLCSSLMFLFCQISINILTVLQIKHKTVCVSCVPIIIPGSEESEGLLSSSWENPNLHQLQSCIYCQHSYLGQLHLWTTNKYFVCVYFLFIFSYIIH